ncbi:MAG TPA: 50S ribosomal protein L10 [Pirellulales bacterium]|nr:50S ribosomal protein L10 [Pirellulales bacterium]
MSQYVKNLITDDLKKRWAGVNDMLVVSVAGLDAQKTFQLRKDLRSQNVQLLVVKNSLARRAVEGTPLAAAFEQAEGSLACMWGASDIVSLAKIVAKLADDKKMAPFAPRGGVMDGAHLTADQVKDVAKWPSREEQLSLLLGQILSPGAKLASQLTSVGGALASQIEQQGEGAEAPAAEAAPA